MEVTMLKKKRYKRGISFLLVLSLITSVIYVTPGYGKEARAASSWNGYTATSYEAGTGTKDNPYQIKWGSQLAYLAKNVSEGETYEGKYFVVTADIRLNVTDGANDWTTWTADTAGLKEWKSIGTYESADSNKPFAGTFNGEGHTISGIWSCNRGTNGLFGYNTGTVSDINVKDSYIEGSGYGVGAVAGKNEGVIYGCSSNANIVSMWADENNIEAGSAGGIAGTNSGTVNYAVNTGTVNGVGVTGGVVGTNAGKIINSGNEGIVGEDVRSQYGTGGIAGCNSKESSEIQNCCNRGNIYADNYAGGIVGTNVGKAVNTYNDADIDITQNKGIAGAVSGALERSGFDSSGSVSYSYWAMTTNITANGALCDNAAAGYTGQNGKVDSNSCMYNAGGYLVDNTGRKEIEFTISGKTEKKDTLSEALDCWTQSDEGGKGSLEYLRWEKGDDGLPKFCQIRSEVWNGDGSNSFGGGDGSEDAPYRITNGEQLKYLAMQVNSGNSYSGENFVLTTDIYLNDEIFTFVPDTGLVEVTDGVNTAYIGTGITGDGSGGSTQFDTAASRTDICYIYDGSSYVQGTYAGDMNSWTPIGTANRPFAGNINGKGYKIHGIYVRDYACEGLFGYIGGGSVKNLGIYNSCFISSGSKYVGSVTGFISGDITKCVVDDTIICSLATDYTGGIAGYFADSPTNSDGSYKDSGLMFGNEFAGVVYGDGTVGGISGYSGYGNRIDECSTNENALIKGDGSAVGGITGRNYGSTILNTYNTGDVTGGNERTYTGGIAGENMSEGESCIEGYPDVFGIIANCYNRGRVTGYTSSHAGGIVGHNFGGTVENSYCDGTVMGNTAGAAAGGIAGVNNISDGKYTLYEGLTQQQYKRCSGNISYSYAIGTITGSNLCDASCIKESVTFSKSGYTLSQPVLGQSTVCDALNAWVKSPDEGLGNDGEFGTYLKWVYPSKEYPRFDGTHFLETPDNEPLPKYSLIYNPNGDDVQGEMKPVVYQMTLNTTPENEKPVVDEVKYTREGYNFAGWNTSPDGDGDKYMPGDRIDITDTTNLYAMWVSTQAVITGVVKNNGNNVTINWSDVDDASGYWIYRHKMDDSNAEFDGFEDADKIGEAGADTLFYIDSELEAGTYYYGIRAYSISGGGVTAIYTFKPFSEPEKVEIATASVTYRDNVPDSTLSVSSECIVGKECELQDNTFAYSGYSFVEWNTQPDGLGDGYQAGETITVNDDITLYAIWKIAPISSLKGEITADGTVMLTWDRSNVEDIAGYRVYCSVGNNSSYTLLGSVENSSSQEPVYETDKLEPSTTYYYKVTAYRDRQTASGTLSEESDDSNEVVITSEARVYLDDTKGLVEDGKHTGIDGNKVFLKWKEEAGVTGYEVYRSTEHDNYGEKIGEVTGVYAGYEDTVLEYGTYYYYIRSYTETKGSGNQVSGITFGDYSGALKVDISSISIEYNSNTKSGAEKKTQNAGKNFEILLDENTFTNEGFTFVGWNTKADSTGERYTDGQTCSFSQDTVLYAMWRINVPIDLAARILDNNINLSWANNTSADGFQIYRKIDDGDFELLDTVVPGDGTYNLYSILGFDKDHTYSFFIRAFVNEIIDDDKQTTSYSDNSDIVTVSASELPEDKVTGVECLVNPDGDDGSKVKISWRKVNIASGYYIYRSDKEGETGQRIAQTEDNAYVDESVPVDEPGDYYYSVRAYVEDADGIYYKTLSDQCRVTFESIRIAYRPNGAEGEAYEKNIIKGSAGVVAEECMFTNPFYEFSDWYTVVDEEVKAYLPGQTIPVSDYSGNINLTARWKLSAVEITDISVNPDSSVSLAWTSNEMATGYNVYQKNGSNGMFVLIGSASERTFTTTPFTDVTTNYFFYVVPYVETAVPTGKLQTEGVPSDSVHIIPNPELIIDGQVTGVSAIIDGDSVILNWDTVKDVTGYYIYRSKEEGVHGECIQTITSADEYTYTDMDIADAGTYYYSIRAFEDTQDAMYYKAWSEFVSVTFDECSITYNANNGTEDSVTEEYIKGTSIDVMANPYIFRGRCFVSWNTDPSGKGFDYKPGDKLALDESTVLYAIWKVEKPNNVKVSVSKDNGTVNVEWEPVSGADGYVICRKNAHTDELTERGTTTKTTFTDYNDGQPIGPDDAYYYYVRAYQTIDSDTRRFGDYSETTEYTVIGNAAVPTKKPVDTVTNLSVVDIIKNENKVKIGWSGIPAADGYRVFYSEEEDGEKIFTGFDDDKSNMVTQVLTPDVKYYFYVVAYIIDSVTGEYRLSDFSKGLEVMITATPAPTPSPTPAPTPTANPYGKVKGVKYQKKSASSIELTWNSLEKADGYRVFKCDDIKGSNPQRIGDDISSTSLLIAGLEENQNYYFYVCGYVIINTDKGEIPEFSDRSDILSVNMSAPTPTPQVTNSPKPEITPTPAPLVTPEPTETPAPTPSASPESGIKDKKAGSFIITDAVNSYISFSWSAVDGAEEYELSYSNTPNGERIPLRRISASETYCRNIEVTGAMFNVRENINVTDVQAYGQTRNEERYYFIRAVAKGEYSQYSDYVKVALHTEQLMAPDATPTPAPNPSPTLSPGTDDDGYTVGSKKKIGKLIYRITAKSNSAMTVEVVRPVKKTYKSVTIPATVKIGGKEYKVTSVKASAFLKNKKLARIVFGKNIRKIGRKSFYGCRKLMNITFKTKNVKSFGKKAFHGITMKCRFIIPKKVLAKYKKLIRKTEG